MTRFLCAYTVIIVSSLSSTAQGQVTPLWSEDFENGCASGCAAAGWPNGAPEPTGPTTSWTVRDNDGGTDGADPNQWYISCAENGQAADQCGSTCIDDESLHIGNGVSAGGDMAASFNETGAANATYKTVVSPTISTVGHSRILLLFDYIAFGSAACADDRGQLRLSTDGGVTWPVGYQYCLTSVCCGACNGYSQGQWTRYALSLPAAFNNNPNVRVGFNWRNNGNGSGTDPSIAIDDIVVGTCDCANDGSCLPNGTCYCHSGWKGPLCQYSDATTCTGHGVAQSDGSCVCAPEFAGNGSCSACAANYYDYPTCRFCDASTTCAGGGTCSTTGTCECLAGFAGAGCQFSDATTCNGRGVAQSDGSCVCETGFAGNASCSACTPNDYYDYPNCTFCDAATSCGGNGSCSTTGTCECSSGFTGPACEYSDIVTCNGHGLALIDGACSCTAGYTGPSCAQCAGDYYAYPTCKYCEPAVTCSGAGTCTALGDCTCVAGVTGAACDIGPAGPSGSSGATGATGDTGGGGSTGESSAGGSTTGTTGETGTAAPSGKATTTRGCAAHQNDPAIGLLTLLSIMLARSPRRRHF